GRAQARAPEWPAGPPAARRTRCDRSTSVYANPSPGPLLPWTLTQPRSCRFSGDQFCDLYRIKRSTLADIVDDDPQVEAARMRQVLADAADIDRIPARRVRDRRRIAARRGLVHQFDPRRIAQQFARVGGTEFVAG